MGWFLHGKKNAQLDAFVHLTIKKAAELSGKGRKEDRFITGSMLNNVFKVVSQQCGGTLKGFQTAPYAKQLELIAQLGAYADDLLKNAPASAANEHLTAPLIFQG